MKDRIEKREIKIINYSTFDLYVLKSEEGLLKSPYYNYDIDSIKAGSSTQLENLFPSWNELIKRSKNGKLTLFVITKDSIKDNGWDKVCQNQSYYKKYQIDIPTPQDMSQRLVDLLVTTRRQ